MVFINAKLYLLFIFMELLTLTKIISSNSKDIYICSNDETEDKYLCINIEQKDCEENNLQYITIQSSIEDINDFLSEKINFQLLIDIREKKIWWFSSFVDENKLLYFPENSCIIPDLFLEDLDINIV